jgi:hypothetical protein
VIVKVFPDFADPASPFFGLKDMAIGGKGM